MRRICWAFVSFCLFCAACPLAVAANNVYLTDAIRNSTYLNALTNLLHSAGKLPPWTQQLLNPTGDYVGNPAAYSTVDGAKYELFYTCMAHECDNNELEVMFAPGGAQAWGALVVDGKTASYLGDPSPAQQAALKAAMQQ
ncbi:MAG: Ivy family c-type lysozyme inhibitor [Xanthobacteraceae bacterium]